LGGSAAGKNCVEFKPVEKPKVLDETERPASSRAKEQVTSPTPLALYIIYLFELEN
jgi:hypothetical protein